MNNVFIGLGSNLDEPLLQLQSAIEYIRNIDDVELHNISDFYRSVPMGPQDQPDYINAVVEISTDLKAENLLDCLQEIEDKQGRIRTQHWGARTLDLDILLYGKKEINTERLMIPHYGMSERNFVLYPLNDLVDDDFEIPGAGKLKQLLAKCPMTGITRLKQA